VAAEHIGAEGNRRDDEQEDKVDPEQRVVDVADVVKGRVVGDPEHPENDKTHEVDDVDVLEGEQMLDERVIAAIDLAIGELHVEDE
jgi:hypothetical protein